MLKNLGLAAVAAAAIGLAPLSTAKAAPVCTSGGFVFCFDFTFGASSASVQYQSGNGTLTAFGIGGYTGIANGAVTSTAGSFSIGNVNNCNAGNFNPVLCATSNNGINGGINPVNSVNLTFTSTGQPGPIGTVHIQAVNGTSCSLWINSNGQIISGANDPNCVPTVVPEPASGFLVATGLLGLGGGLIRRRRKNS